MGSPFASGKNAISICDRCSVRFKLTELRNQIVKQKPTGLMVCKGCYDEDHPQLMLGTYPIQDPQALRNPRPDTSYYVSGLTVDDSLGGGSRIIQWNWAPVGGFNTSIDPLTPDAMLMTGEVGTVTVTTS